MQWEVCLHFMHTVYISTPSLFIFTRPSCSIFHGSGNEGEVGGGGWRRGNLAQYHLAEMCQVIGTWVEKGEPCPIPFSRDVSSYRHLIDSELMGTFYFNTYYMYCTSTHHAYCTCSHILLESRTYENSSYSLLPLRAGSPATPWGPRPTTRPLPTCKKNHHLCLSVSLHMPAILISLCCFNLICYCVGS